MTDRTLVRIAHSDLSMVVDLTEGRVVSVYGPGSRRDWLKIGPERRETDRRFGIGGMNPDVETKRWRATEKPLAVTLKAEDAESAQARTFSLVAGRPVVRATVELVNRRASPLLSMAGPAVSFAGRRVHDSRILFHETAEGEATYEPFYKSSRGYATLAGHAGWVGWMDVRRSIVFVAVTDAAADEFSVGIMSGTHLTIIPTHPRRVPSNGAGQSRQEFWFLTAKNYEAVGDSALLRGSALARLRRRLADLFAPERRAIYTRLVTREQFRRTRVNGRVHGEFVRTRDRSRHVCRDGIWEVPAGSVGRWRLEISCSRDVREGGSFYLRRRNSSVFGAFFQTDDPRERDYVRVKSPKGVRLVVSRDDMLYNEVRHYVHTRSSRCLKITVAKGCLKKNEMVELTIGALNRDRGSYVINSCSDKKDPRCRRNRHCEVYVDATGAKHYDRIARFVCRTVPDTPARLVLLAASCAARGTARVGVKVEDAHANLCETFKGTVTVHGPVMENGTKIPLKGGLGEMRVTLLPGIETARIQARVDGSRLRGESNVLRVCPENATRIYWGEMHLHTSLSHDGQGRIRRAYRYGRDASQLDFCAITDHTPSRFPGRALPPEEEAYFTGSWWDEHRESARLFYEPDRFVPLLAQETAPGDGGNHDVYHASYDSPVVIPFTAGKNPAAVRKAYNHFYAFLRKHKILAIPHHGGGPKDWRYHDGRVERCVEIASNNGVFESFYHEGLRRGYRLGVVAASDHHLGTPGTSGYLAAGSRLTPGLIGLGHFSNGCVGWTALLARRLDLNAVLSALRNRRCYAVTGRIRPLISFRVDNHGMGSEFRTSDRPHVEVRVVGEKPIRSVHVIRNDSEILREGAGGSGYAYSWIDAGVTRGLNVYYVRVVFRDDEVAWTSPVWVDYQGPATRTRDSERPWNEEDIKSLDNLKEDPAAAQYRERFLAHLQPFAGDRFHGIKGVRLIDDGYARQAVFFGLDKARDDAHIRFAYLYDLERPLMRSAYTWTVYDCRIQ